MATPVSNLPWIRRAVAVACVLAILAQALVMAVGATDGHHHDADATHQQMLDLSHAVGEASHDCHNGSHCHGCVPVFGLSAGIPVALLDSQHGFAAMHANTPPRYSPVSPFRPPIV